MALLFQMMILTDILPFNGTVTVLIAVAVLQIGSGCFTQMRESWLMGLLLLMHLSR